MPYGENTDPVDAFDYEEMPGEPKHADYLWVSPVFACMLVLGRTFTRRGWDFSGGMDNDIHGLPLHTYRHEGGSVVKPCAEVLFSDRALEKVLECGVMALLSYREQDRVRLAGLRSIASPPATLVGRWG
jgi:type VI secretion system protein ImpC